VDIGVFFDNDGVDAQGLGVEGVFELETEAVAEGVEGEADTVAEGGMPGYRLLPVLLCVLV
jgi:hypothetical protein